jgi:hypothetical protein
MIGVVHPKTRAGSVLKLHSKHQYERHSGDLAYSVSHDAGGSSRRGGVSGICIALAQVRFPKAANDSVKRRGIMVGDGMMHTVLTAYCTALYVAVISHPC